MFPVDQLCQTAGDKPSSKKFRIFKLMQSSES